MNGVVMTRLGKSFLPVDSVTCLVRMVLVLCLCQISAALAREPDVTPEDAGPSSERLARFADYANAMAESGKIPGATIAISRFGKLAYFETIGWADIDERKPTRADTLYRLHSMTKPLFSVATMTLAEEGRLSLHEPISKYIPEFADVNVLCFFVDPTEQLVGLFFTQVYPGGTYDLRRSLLTFTYQALID